MSRELIQPIIHRIRSKEADALEERAEREAAQQAESEQVQSDAAMLRERAEKFATVLRQTRDRYRNQGLLSRMIRGRYPNRTEFYWDFLQKDFITVSE